MCIVGIGFLMGCSSSLLPTPTPTVRAIPAVPIPTVEPDYTGEMCRFYNDMVSRRNILKRTVISLRRNLIALDYNAPRERVWQAIDNFLPSIQSLLLGVGVYSDWLLRITPPREGGGLYTLELQTVEKMRNSLSGYIQAGETSDFLTLLSSRDEWISAMTFFAATERDLVVYDEEFRCSTF